MHKRIENRKQQIDSSSNLIINTLIMKISENQFFSQQKILVSFTLLILFALVSCTPAQDGSKQQTENPGRQHKQTQQNTVKEVSPSIPATETPESIQSGQTAEKIILNPPHGQPGHRCDIPVGNPLNGAPATKVTEVAKPTPEPAKAIVNNPTAPTIENANRMNPSNTRSTSEPATGTKPRNNPPHGQPWHRCDIPVGSPLP